MMFPSFQSSWAGRILTPSLFLPTIFILLTLGAGNASAQQPNSASAGFPKPTQVTADQIQIKKLQKALTSQRTALYYKSMFSEDLLKRIEASNDTTPEKLQPLKQDIAAAVNAQIASGKDLLTLPGHPDTQIQPLPAPLNAEIQELQTKAVHGSLDDNEQKRRNFLLAESITGGAIEVNPETVKSTATPPLSSPPLESRSADALKKSPVDLTGQVDNINRRIDGVNSRIVIMEWGMGFLAAGILVGLGAPFLLPMVKKWREGKAAKAADQDLGASAAAAVVIDDNMSAQAGDEGKTEIGSSSALLSQEEDLDSLAKLLPLLLGPKGTCRHLISDAVSTVVPEGWKKDVIQTISDPNKADFMGLYKSIEDYLRAQLKGDRDAPLSQVILSSVEADLKFATGNAPSLLESAIVGMLSPKPPAHKSQALYHAIAEIGQKSAEREVKDKGLTLTTVQTSLLGWIQPKTASAQPHEIQSALHQLTDSRVKTSLEKLDEAVLKLADQQGQIGMEGTQAALLLKRRAKADIALQERQSAMLYEIEQRTHCAADVTKFERLAYHLRSSLLEAFDRSFPEASRSDVAGKRISIIREKFVRLEHTLTTLLTASRTALAAPRAAIDLDALRHCISQLEQLNIEAPAEGASSGKIQEEKQKNWTAARIRFLENIEALYQNLQEGIGKQTEVFNTNIDIFSKLSVKLYRAAADLREPLEDIYRCAHDPQQPEDSEAWQKLFVDFCGMLRDCDVEVLLPLSGGEYRQSEHRVDQESYINTRAEKRVVDHTVAPGIRVGDVIEQAVVQVREKMD